MGIGGREGGRGSRGPEIPPERRFERMPESPERMSEVLDEIDRRLADLLEKGTEWDAQVRAMRRQGILNLMQSIGIDGFADVAGFARAHQAARAFWDSTFTTATMNKTPTTFSDPKGYFSTLGLTPAELEGKTEADAKTTIRSRYWELAKEHYPAADRGDTAATEMMKAINVAYGVLKDPRKRSDYLKSG